MEENRKETVVAIRGEMSSGAAQTMALAGTVGILAFLVSRKLFRQGVFPSFLQAAGVTTYAMRFIRTAHDQRDLSKFYLIGRPENESFIEVDVTTDTPVWAEPFGGREL